MREMCIRDRGMEVTNGMDLLLFGNIPNGSGLSSSASVEVLTGYILREMCIRDRSYYLKDEKHFEICKKFLDWTLKSQIGRAHV